MVLLMIGRLQRLHTLSSAINIFVHRSQGFSMQLIVTLSLLLRESLPCL